MYKINKKNKANKAVSPFGPSANKVGSSEVPSAKSVNPGEFSAMANLKALKKSGPNSIESVKQKEFVGADKLEGSELEVKSNSAYLERIKKRANK